jgi:hypothetical protein
MNLEVNQKVPPLRQLTIRGFDDRLERRIRQIARAEGISLNRAVLKLLRRGAGLGEPDPGRDVIGDALDRHIGTWSEGDARELEEATRDLSEVDPALFA